MSHGWPFVHCSSVWRLAAGSWMGEGTFDTSSPEYQSISTVLPELLDKFFTTVPEPIPPLAHTGLDAAADDFAILAARRAALRASRARPEVRHRRASARRRSRPAGLGGRGPVGAAVHDAGLRGPHHPLRRSAAASDQWCRASLHRHRRELSRRQPGFDLAAERGRGPAARSRRGLCLGRHTRYRDRQRDVRRHGLERHVPVQGPHEGQLVSARGHREPVRGGGA